VEVCPFLGILEVGLPYPLAFGCSSSFLVLAAAVIAAPTVLETFLEASVAASFDSVAVVVAAAAAEASFFVAVVAASSFVVAAAVVVAWTFPAAWASVVPSFDLLVHSASFVSGPVVAFAFVVAAWAAFQDLDLLRLPAGHWTAASHVG